MRNFNLLLLVALLLTTSCASIINGSKRKVLYETDPPGATVMVNGMEMGKTPVEIKVRADDRVTFNLDDYQERVVVMDSKFNLVSLLNGISIIGWGVDAITGSIKRVDTKYVKVSLRPEDKTAFIDYMDNGSIEKVTVDTESKVIETVIVLNN